MKKPTMAEPILQTQNLSVTAGSRVILRGVTLGIEPRQVFGLIGPSGAGKSTLLKCLNRLVDLTPTLRVEGDIRFHGRSIFRGGIDADALRARIGILFQQPVVFPKSVYKNVIFGVKHLGEVPKAKLPEVAERALREAALWEEVKDRLHQPALRLSVGQQQRLCLARALASRPEVILMDEPTSALDPKSTEAIEQLIVRLKQDHTIVLVTHNVRQARQLADQLACVCVRDDVGQVIAQGEPCEVLCSSCAPEIEAYLATG
jgi:phosphate transport system ATP-binding protein